VPNFNRPDGAVRSQEELKPIKMLYLGHTGAGKTGSLVSLAAAGYDVRILDLDAGVDILDDYINNKEQSPYLKPRAPLWDGEYFGDRISYMSATEQYMLQGSRAIPRGTSWARIAQTLGNWIDGERKYGNIASWGPNCILAIDGLSRLCEAAMNFQLSLVGRLDKGPRVGTSDSNDYSQAYSYILEMLNLLKSTDIKCHIIMICHIKFIVDRAQRDPQSKDALRDLKGFPQTVGAMLAPQIGQYFNHTLRAKSIQTGPLSRRVIVTDNDESIDLKSVVPLKVKKEYPLESGLAEYFYAVRGPVRA
jgi:hypothetical protein